jgi:hypothetical protein
MKSRIFHTVSALCLLASTACAPQVTKQAEPAPEAEATTSIKNSEPTAQKRWTIDASGGEYERIYRIGNTDMPLPPGRWTLLAAGDRHSEAYIDGKPDRVAYAILAHLRGNWVVGLATLVGTRARDRIGQPRPWKCDNVTNPIFTNVMHKEEFVSSGERHCTASMFFVRGEIGKLTEDAVAEEQVLDERLKALGLLRNAGSLATRIRIDRGGQIAGAIYEIFPEQYSSGLVTTYRQGKGYVWEARNLPNNPQHKIFSSMWIHWSTQMTAVVGLGMDLRLGNYQPTPYPFALD